MLLGGPAAHVGTSLGEQPEGSVGPEGVELGEIDAGQLVERPAHGSRFSCCMGGPGPMTTKHSTGEATSGRVA